jgi:hypothetical protein
MKIYRTALIAAALGVAALAGSPAWANLYISCSGAAECNTGSGYIAENLTGNSGTAFVGTLGNFDFNVLSMVGQAGNRLVDNNSQDINSIGSGSLTVQLSETNLTGAQVLNILGTFGTTVADDINETRGFWVDANDGINAHTTFLGCTSNNLGCGGTNGTNSFSSQFVNVNGTYSLTEEIDLSATGPNGTFSADDFVSVPEPISLSLFGSGLVALGAFSARRRRKAADKS